MWTQTGFLKITSAKSYKRIDTLITKYSHSQSIKYELMLVKVGLALVTGIYIYNNCYNVTFQIFFHYCHPTKPLGGIS